MNNKLKYYQRKIAEPIEFPQEVARIMLPDGNEYTFQYSTVHKGLIVTKVYTEDDSSTAISVLPQVSNQIVIK